jgi:hypothetical protein
MKHACAGLSCDACGYCASWAERAVTMDETYRSEALTQAAELDQGFLSGAHWFASSPEFAQHQSGVMPSKRK